MSTRTFVFQKLYKYKPWHDNKCISIIKFPVGIEIDMQSIFVSSKAIGSASTSNCFGTPLLNEMVTIAHAIDILETFLSEKISQEYIDSHPKEIESYTKYYGGGLKPEIKGYLLENYVFLEDIELENNTAILVIGS